MKLSVEEAKAYLTAFAEKHKINFIEKGTCGFCRDCVGLSSDGKYIDHNPIDMVEYDPIPEFANEDLYPPAEVKNEYHKHNCLAVLVHDEDYDSAIQELYIWIKHIESLGEVKIVSYNPGATGLQALFSGTTAKAITIDSSKQNDDRKTNIL